MPGHTKAFIERLFRALNTLIHTPSLIFEEVEGRHTDSRVFQSVCVRFEGRQNGVHELHALLDLGIQSFLGRQGFLVSVFERIDKDADAPSAGVHHPI